MLAIVTRIFLLVIICAVCDTSNNNNNTYIFGKKNNATTSTATSVQQLVDNDKTNHYNIVYKKITKINEIYVPIENVIKRTEKIGEYPDMFFLNLLSTFCQNIDITTNNQQRANSYNTSINDKKWNIPEHLLKLENSDNYEVVKNNCSNSRKDALVINKTLDLCNFFQEISFKMVSRWKPNVDLEKNNSVNMLLNSPLTNINKYSNNILNEPKFNIHGKIGNNDNKSLSEIQSDDIGSENNMDISNLYDDFLANQSRSNIYYNLCEYSTIRKLSNICHNKPRLEPVRYNQSTDPKQIISPINIPIDQNESHFMKNKLPANVNNRNNSWTYSYVFPKKTISSNKDKLHIQQIGRQEINNNNIVKDTSHYNNDRNSNVSSERENNKNKITHVLLKSRQPPLTKDSAKIFHSFYNKPINTEMKQLSVSENKITFSSETGTTISSNEKLLINKDEFSEPKFYLHTNVYNTNDFLHLKYNFKEPQTNLTFPSFKSKLYSKSDISILTSNNPGEDNSHLRNPVHNQDIPSINKLSTHDRESYYLKSTRVLQPYDYNNNTANSLLTTVPIPIKEDNIKVNLSHIYPIVNKTLINTFSPIFNIFLETSYHNIPTTQVDSNKLYTNSYYKNLLDKKVPPVTTMPILNDALSLTNSDINEMYTTSASTDPFPNSRIYVKINDNNNNTSGQDNLNQSKHLSFDSQNNITDFMNPSTYDYTTIDENNNPSSKVHFHFEEYSQINSEFDKLTTNSILNTKYKLITNNKENSKDVVEINEANHYIPNDLVAKKTHFANPNIYSKTSNYNNLNVPIFWNTQLNTKFSTILPLSSISILPVNNNLSSKQEKFSNTISQPQAIPLYSYPNSSNENKFINNFLSNYDSKKVYFSSGINTSMETDNENYSTNRNLYGNINTNDINLNITGKITHINLPPLNKNVKPCYFAPTSEGKLSQIILSANKNNYDSNEEKISEDHAKQFVDSGNNQLTCNNSIIYYIDNIITDVENLNQDLKLSNSHSHKNQINENLFIYPSSVTNIFGSNVNIVSYNAPLNKHNLQIVIKNIVSSFTTSDDEKLNIITRFLSAHKTSLPNKYISSHNESLNIIIVDKYRIINSNDIEEIYKYILSEITTKYEEKKLHYFNDRENFILNRSRKKPLPLLHNYKDIFKHNTVSKFNNMNQTHNLKNTAVPFNRSIFLNNIKFIENGINTLGNHINGNLNYGNNSYLEYSNPTNGGTNINNRSEEIIQNINRNKKFNLPILRNHNTINSDINKSNTNSEHFNLYTQKTRNKIILPPYDGNVDTRNNEIHNQFKANKRGYTNNNSESKIIYLLSTVGKTDSFSSSSAPKIDDNYSQNNVKYQYNTKIFPSALKQEKNTKSGNNHYTFGNHAIGFKDVYYDQTNTPYYEKQLKQNNIVQSLTKPKDFQKAFSNIELNNFNPLNKSLNIPGVNNIASSSLNEQLFRIPKLKYLINRYSNLKIPYFFSASSERTYKNGRINNKYYMKSNPPNQFLKDFYDNGYMNKSYSVFRSQNNNPFRPPKHSINIQNHDKIYYDKISKINTSPTYNWHTRLNIDTYNHYKDLNNNENDYIISHNKPSDAKHNTIQVKTFSQKPHEYTSIPFFPSYNQILNYINPKLHLNPDNVVIQNKYHNLNINPKIQSRKYKLKPKVLKPESNYGDVSLCPINNIKRRKTNENILVNSSGSLKQKDDCENI